MVKKEIDKTSEILERPLPAEEGVAGESADASNALIFHDELTMKERLKIRKKMMGVIGKVYYKLFPQKLEQVFINEQLALTKFRVIWIMCNSKELEFNEEEAVKYLMLQSPKSVFDQSDHFFEEQLIELIGFIGGETKIYLAKFENGEKKYESELDFFRKNEERYLKKILEFTDFYRNKKVDKINFRLKEYLGLIFKDDLERTKFNKAKVEIVEAMSHFQLLETILKITWDEKRVDEIEKQKFKNEILSLLYEMCLSMDINMLELIEILLKLKILNKKEIKMRIEDILEACFARMIERNLGLRKTPKLAILEFLEFRKGKKDYLKKYFLNLNKERKESEFEELLKVLDNSIVVLKSLEAA